ncbi:hypothetical protein C8J56DRAFT_477718 [Mycena floridula]|nr:hypothetical protein C8J56DRAFT_477718 [Mycena floridula]
MQSLRPVCTHCHKDTSFRPETVTSATWPELKALLRSPHTSTSTSSPAFLAGAKLDIRKCQEEIDRLKIYTRGLETSMMKNLQRNHDAAEALSAPIRKLPPEILGLIFSEVCDWNVIGDGNIDLPGLRLAAVCFHWRTVVMSTKFAWSRIRWVIQGYEQDFTMHSIESMNIAVQFLLGKSSNQALDVKLEFHADADMDDIDQGWLTVVAQCHRWQSLSLEMAERSLDWVKKWISEVVTELPLLRHLAVSDTDSENGDVVTFDFLQKAPQLSVIWFDHDVFTSLGKLPTWTQRLRVVSFNKKMDSRSMENSRHPLSPLFSCTNVTEAQISCDLVGNLYLSDSLARQRNVVATLQSLELNSIRRISVVMPLLSALSFPGLSSLRLVGSDKWKNYEDIFRPPFSLEPFLSHSQCTITVLSLKNLLFNRAEWISMLRALPALRNLFLEQEDDNPLAGEELISDTFFNQMNEMPPLLPNIERLSIQVPYPSISSTPVLFLDTIESRWMPDSLCDAIACLKFVSLVLPGLSIDTDTIRALERLARAGMTITVKDLTGYVVG